LTGGRVGPNCHDQKDQFKDVDDHKAKDSETVKSMDGLPHWIFGIGLIPNWNLNK
jgi:hypothetical protein